MLATSVWSSVKFASLISRDVRMGALTASQGKKLMLEFDAVVKDSLIKLISSAADNALAVQYVTTSAVKLRESDALQHQQ